MIIGASAAISNRWVALLFSIALKKIKELMING
jgi:hypothetical protein